MERLPENEPGSILWQGGESNKGDEPDEPRDPKETDAVVELARDDEGEPAS